MTVHSETGIDDRDWLSHAETSVLFRACRQLLDKGKPLPPAGMIAVNLKGQGLRPFGLLTFTSKRRFVFWPVIPLEIRSMAEQGTVFLTDHVTLELPSFRTHVTGYRKDGSNEHRSMGWKVQEFSPAGLGLWFICALRINTLYEQPLHVKRGIHLPTADSARRIEEFSKFTSQIRHIDVEIPPAQTQGDYLLTYFSVIDSSKVAPDPPVLPLVGNLDDIITGWDVGAETAFASRLFRFESVQMVISFGCPPGTCSEEMLGFPNASQLDRLQHLAGHRS